MSTSDTFPKGLAACTAVAVIGLTGLLVFLIGWEPDELYMNADGDIHHGPNYAFYDLSGSPLEPLSPPEALAEAKASSAGVEDAEAIAPTIVANTDKPEPQTSAWVVQAGAFQDLREADARKAELLLLGLEAHVETEASKDGVPWHRVLIGPIESDNELESTKTVLSEANIDQMTKALQ